MLKTPGFIPVSANLAHYVAKSSHRGEMSHLGLEWVKWPPNRTNSGLSVVASDMELPLRKIAIWLSKIAKNLTFFQKKMPKFLLIFKKINFFLKKIKNFGNFFFLNVKFLAIFWHSNGNFPEGQIQVDTKWDKSGT